MILKAVLSAANNANWTESPTLVLLGIRNALKTDAGYAVTELVYGTILRLPDVFVRRVFVRRPLEPPYDGLYEVIGRMDRFFVVDRKGREDSISIDRWKPAY
ncbi:unnamed protein product [Trichobilharzia regenti]|nr:unnamed protein product [Trichobilharzia regenti]